MKVKNIMFSGFMAAIMMSATAGVANAAVSVASRGYVDQQVGTKVSTSDFNTFKTENEAAIEDAKAAGTDASDALDAYKTEVSNTYATQTYVGTFTSDTAQTIVDYINEKTTGIATNTALGELQGKVTANEGAITALQNADTTINGKLEVLEGEGEGSVAKAEADAIAAAKEYADGLADNYDAAGTAAGLVKALEEGDVADNTSAINTLKSDVETNYAKTTAVTSAITEATKDLATKGTTLAHYGITDASTTEQMNAAIGTAKSGAEATAKNYTDAEIDKLSALAQADFPQECTAGEKMCVLTLTKVTDGGTPVYAWVALTEPSEDQ